MSDSSSTRQTAVVGLFVLIALLILGGGIFTIGSMTDAFSKKVRITATFDEVGGLQAGNNIWFSGVKVGVVKDVHFVEGSKVQVDMAVDESATPFIPGDALAKIGSDGFIGDTIVVLYEGTPAQRPLEDGDVLAVGTEVSTAEIMATFQKNNENLVAITTDLKDLTGRIARGEGSIGQLLADDDLFAKVETAVAALERASGSAEEMSGDLAAFTNRLDDEGTLVHSLVTDRETYATITESVDKLGAVADDAAKVVDGIEKATASDDTPIGTLLNDQGADQDLDAVLANLSEGTALLNENLEAMQHNFLLRGFFKKKEKAAAEEKSTTPSAEEPGEQEEEEREDPPSAATTSAALP